MKLQYTEEVRMSETGKAASAMCRPDYSALTMTSKFRLFLPALVFLFLFQLPAGAQHFEPVSPADAGFSEERLQRLTGVLHDYAAQGRLSGGVLLVLRDGKALVHEPFGRRDVESDDPMQTDAMFRIASQTKAIVSVAVMMLQEEGKLLITDPVGNYIPEFRETKVAVRNESGGYDVVQANRRITIRDLLTHTSGIGYGYGVAADAWRDAGIQGWYFADRDEPLREIVKRMPLLPNDAHPGERYVYGYSTDILGVLVEVVSGTTLGDFLQERIFGPLNMRDTHFFVPAEKAGRLATVYSATDGRGIERAPDPGGSVGQGHYLNGPAADYGRFLQMMLNRGELNGKRILSPRTVDLMTISHLAGIPFRDGLGMGLGFDVVENVGSRGVPGSPGDFGWGGAYHSTYWVSPTDRLVVVFLTQLIPATGSDIHGKIRTLLYQAMSD
jgi:CubicO group peptidase (beta-lactamase class C family)